MRNLTQIRIEIKTDNKKSKDEGKNQNKREKEKEGRRQKQCEEGMVSKKELCGDILKQEGKNDVLMNYKKKTDTRRKARKKQFSSFMDITAIRK